MIFTSWSIYWSSQSIFYVLSDLTPQEIHKIREAIKNASSLQEVERLTRMLQSGQIPGQKPLQPATQANGQRKYILIGSQLQYFKKECMAVSLCLFSKDILLATVVILIIVVLHWFRKVQYFRSLLNISQSSIKWFYGSHEVYQNLSIKIILLRINILSFFVIAPSWRKCEDLLPGP